MRLKGQERKLLDAHYADQISPDLFADEQTRIRRERVAAEMTIGRLTIQGDRAQRGLSAAVALMHDAQASYLRCEDTDRRLLNQAFFDRIEIDIEDIADVAMTRPFADIVQAGRARWSLPRQRHLRREQPRTKAANVKRRPEGRRLVQISNPWPDSSGRWFELWGNVELAGALSEPREHARWERLARRLVASPGRTPAEPLSRTLPRRQGWVWPAIRRVLATTDGPMRPVAIYAAVVEDLDRPVSKSTIKNELKRRLTVLPLELGQNNYAAYFLIRP
jgi:hypothetical protein